MSAENSSPETPATPPAHPARAATAGKVRWRRFAILMIPSAAVAAVLVGLTASIGCGGQASLYLNGLVKNIELAALGRRVAEQEYDLLELLAGRDI